MRNAALIKDGVVVNVIVVRDQSFKPPEGYELVYDPEKSGGWIGHTYDREKREFRSPKVTPHEPDPKTLLAETMEAALADAALTKTMKDLIRAWKRTL